MKTVVGLFQNDRKVVSKVLDDLQREGIPEETVSTVQTTPGGKMQDAGKGALMGGAAGLLLGASALLVPGLGWVAIAGPITTMLMGAGAGAAVGGVIGALTERGVPEEDAHFYAEGLRRGGTVVTVHAQNEDQAARAEEAMRRNGAAGIGARRAEWKQRGWSGRFGDEPAGAEDETLAPIAAVCVYDVVIELPEGYAGPERRKQDGPYAGMERRAA